MAASERLNLIHALKRKYGSSLAEVIAFGNDARKKLQQLEQRDVEVARLNADLQKAEAALLKAAKELTQVCNLFGYGEIKPLGAGYYGSTMIQYFSQIAESNFQTVQIQRKEDIWPSFKTFLSKDRVRDDAAQ